MHVEISASSSSYAAVLTGNVRSILIRLIGTRLDRIVTVQGPRISHPSFAIQRVRRQPKMAATKFLCCLLLVLFTRHNLVPKGINYLSQLYLRLPSSGLRKFHAAAVCYTPNGISKFNPFMTPRMVLLSGDVELNPGPKSEEMSSHQGLFEVGLPTKGLRIGAWNINRLTDAKFQHIKLLLTSQQVDILFLIETFLKPRVPDSVYAVQGYELLRKDRPGKTKGGGILCYFNNRLKASKATELEENEVQTLWLKVNPYNSNRDILLGAVYRPPSSNIESDRRIEANIETAYIMNKETHILGDFNIDFLKPSYKKHTLSKSLKSMNFTQLIDKVTRPESATCLDHVYTTNSEFITHVKVSDIGIADHLPIFIRRKYFQDKNLNQESNHLTIKYRETKNLNINELYT